MKLSIAIVCLFLCTVACSQSNNTAPEKNKTTQTNSIEQPGNDDTSSSNNQVEDGTVSAPVETTPPIKETAMPTMQMALLKTNQGEIKIELNTEKAPLSVANFIEYAKAGHYDGTIFHRVIAGFMIQGGGFTPEMEQKPTNTPVQNEANNGLSNETFSLAMARTSAPHSATSQFFINVSDNSRLDFTSESGSGWGYAVFGKVVEGQDVVKAIEAVETGQSGPYGDVPKESVLIESVTIVE